MDRILDNIRVISNYIRRKLDANDKETGVSANKRGILRYVEKASISGPVYEKDMGEHFNLQRSTITGIVAGLESDGFIERVPSTHDGRYKEVKLTNKGQEICRQGEDVVGDIERQLTKTLSVQDKKVLLDYMKRMIENLG